MKFETDNPRHKSSGMESYPSLQQLERSQQCAHVLRSRAIATAWRSISMAVKGIGHTKSKVESLEADSAEKMVSTSSNLIRICPEQASSKRAAADDLNLAKCG